MVHPGGKGPISDAPQLAKMARKRSGDSIVIYKVSPRSVALDASDLMAAQR